MDAVPHCPDAGFSPDIRLASRAHDRRLAVCIAVALALFLGFLAGVGATVLSVDAGAPALRCADSLASLESRP